ncbi:MAG: hypothetical protein ABUK01_02305 [Leptospirales bacterium]
MRRSLKQILLLWLPLLLVTSGGCVLNLSYNEQEFLERPVDLAVTALSGQKFKVEYNVQNKEDTFDGYNLYISRHSSGDGGGNLNLKAYNYDGSVPTFVHSSADYDLTNTVSVTLYDYMGVTQAIDGSTVVYYVPFETGVTYYFKIKAHSQFDTLSEFSNEVSATTLR